jgi:pimeloyl-ACP methyl ester carboxylesterase
MKKRFLTSLRSLGCVTLFLGLAACSTQDSSTPQDPDIEPQELRFSRETLAEHKTKIAVGSATLEDVVPTKCGYRAYKMVYETPNTENKMVKATGVIAIPEETNTAPIMSFQHGTVTHREDSPSKMDTDDGIGMIGFIFSGSCYVVVAPDYVGLGDGEGYHPYLHAATEASASADLLKVTVEFLQKKGFQWNRKLFLAGYSQGGHATMALHRHLEANGPYDVTAAAPMAGPYDLSGTTAKILLSYPGPKTNLYASFLMFSMQKIYNMYADFTDAVIAPWHTQLDGLYDGTKRGDEIQKALPAKMEDFLTERFVTGVKAGTEKVFLSALQDNDVYNWAPRAPVRLYHASGDRDVPYANSQVALKSMTANGSTVSLVDLGNLSHGAAFVPAVIAAHRWFQSQ